MSIIYQIICYICGEHIAKVFSYPSWKCGSFQNLGITEYISLALTMPYACAFKQVDTPYQSECGVSVIYRERFFHDLHGISEMNSTLSMYKYILVRSSANAKIMANKFILSLMHSATHKAHALGYSLPVQEDRELNLDNLSSNNDIFGINLQ